MQSDAQSDKCLQYNMVSTLLFIIQHQNKFELSKKCIFIVIKKLYEILCSHENIYHSELIHISEITLFHCLSTIVQNYICAIDKQSKFSDLIIDIFLFTSEELDSLIMDKILSSSSIALVSSESYSAASAFYNDVEIRAPWRPVLYSVKILNALLPIGEFSSVNLPAFLKNENISLFLRSNIGYILLKLILKNNIPILIFEMILSIFMKLILVSGSYLIISIEYFIKYVALKALSDLKVILNPSSHNGSSYLGREYNLDEIELILELLIDLFSEKQFMILLFTSSDFHELKSSLGKDIVFAVSDLFQLCAKSVGVIKKSVLSNIISNLNRCFYQLVSFIISYDKDELYDSKFYDNIQEVLCIKKLLKDSATLFEESPSKCFLFLEEHQFFPANCCESGLVANFLRRNRFLSRKSIGMYLGDLGKEKHSHISESKKFHHETLISFVNNFNLNGQSLLNCLRIFLSAFRLPGEAQQIDRILIAFSNKCFESCIESSAGHIENADIVYLLTFSIIMLNTDRHNPNIRFERKMTLDQFVRNNTNYGLDVSQTKPLHRVFLTEIYHSISSNPLATSDYGLSSKFSDELWMDAQLQYFPNVKVIDRHSQYTKITRSHCLVDDSNISLLDEYSNFHPLDNNLVRFIFESIGCDVICYLLAPISCQSEVDGVISLDNSDIDKMLYFLDKIFTISRCIDFHSLFNSCLRHLFKNVSIMYSRRKESLTFDFLLHLNIIIIIHIFNKFSSVLFQSSWDIYWLSLLYLDTLGVGAVIDKSITLLSCSVDSLEPGESRDVFSLDILATYIRAAYSKNRFSFEHDSSMNLLSTFLINNSIMEVISDSRFMDDSSLTTCFHSFLKTYRKLLFKDSDIGDDFGNNIESFSNFIFPSWFDSLLIELCTRNRERFASCLWQNLKSFYLDTFSLSKLHSSDQLVNMTSTLFIICSKMLSRASSEILCFLESVFCVYKITGMNNSNVIEESLYLSLATTIIDGLEVLVTTNVVVLPKLKLEDWQRLFNLVGSIGMVGDDCSRKALKIVVWILYEKTLVAEVPVFIIDCIYPLVVCTNVPRLVSLSAVDLCLYLHSRLVSLNLSQRQDMEDNEDEMTIHYDIVWLPIIHCLCEGILIKDVDISLSLACSIALSSILTDSRIFNISSGILINLFTNSVISTIKVLCCNMIEFNKLGTFIIEAISDSTNLSEIHDKTGPKNLLSPLQILTEALVFSVNSSVKDLLRHPSFDKLWLEILDLFCIYIATFKDNNISPIIDARIFKKCLDSILLKNSNIIKLNRPELWNLSIEMYPSSILHQQ